MRSCFGHAESDVSVGHLVGDVQQAGRNMGVELGSEDIRISFL